MSKSDNLIWIDLEMTGLKTDSDSIIEIATTVTDKELNILADGPVMALHQPDSVLSSHGRLEPESARLLGASRARARKRNIGCRRRGAHA